MDWSRHWASHKVTGLNSKKYGAPGSRVQRADGRPTTLCIPPLLITTQMDHGWRIWHHLLPPRATMVSPASRPLAGPSREWHHSRDDLLCTCPCRGDPVTFQVPLIPVARLSSAPHGSLINPCSYAWQDPNEGAAGLLRDQTCSYQVLSRSSILGSWVIFVDSARTMTRLTTTYYIRDAVESDISHTYLLLTVVTLNVAGSHCLPAVPLSSSWIQPPDFNCCCLITVLYCTERGSHSGNRITV